MDLAMLAANAAGLVWRLLRGAAEQGATAAGDAGSQVLQDEAAGVVRRLWERLRSHKAVETAAEDDAPDALEELARQIGRALERDQDLARDIAALVEEARQAGEVVEGHALVERVRASATSGRGNVGHRPRRRGRPGRGGTGAGGARAPKSLTSSGAAILGSVVGRDAVVLTVNVTQALAALGARVALPPPAPGDWGLVGRHEDLARLHKHLGRHGEAAVVPVAGTGGIGKTALAIGYVAAYGDNYNLIVWLDAERPERIAAQYSALVLSNCGLNLPEVEAVAAAKGPRRNYWTSRSACVQPWAA